VSTNTFSLSGFHMNVLCIFPHRQAFSAGWVSPKLPHLAVRMIKYRHILVSGEVCSLTLVPFNSLLIEFCCPIKVFHRSQPSLLVVLKEMTLIWDDSRDISQKANDRGYEYAPFRASLQLAPKSQRS